MATTKTTAKTTMNDSEMMAIMNAISFEGTKEIKKNISEINGFYYSSSSNGRDVSTFLKKAGRPTNDGVARAYYCHLDSDEVKAYKEKVEFAKMIAPDLVEAIRGIIKAHGKENAIKTVSALTFLFSKAEGDLSMNKAVEKANSFDKQALADALQVCKLAHTKKGLPAPLPKTEVKKQSKAKVPDILSGLW